MALRSNHCRCTQNSLPRSIKRLMTNSSSTHVQDTPSRLGGKRFCQNFPIPCSCQIAHPSRQSSKALCRHSCISESLTWIASTPSGGTSRSSEKRDSIRDCRVISSITSGVFRYAACCVSLISPTCKTVLWTTYPEVKRWLSTRLKYRCFLPSILRMLERRIMPGHMLPKASRPRKRVGLHFKRIARDRDCNGRPSRR